MIGRAAYSNPFLFAAVDREFFGSTAEEVSRRDVVLRMVCRIIFTPVWRGLHYSAASRRNRLHSANSDQGQCNIVRWNMRRSRWTRAKSCGASYDTCSACTPTCPEVKAYPLAPFSGGRVLCVLNLKFQEPRIGRSTCRRDTRRRRCRCDPTSSSKPWSSPTTPPSPPFPSPGKQPNPPPPPHIPNPTPELELTIYCSTINHQTP